MTESSPALRYDSAPARRRTILGAVEEAGFVSVADLSRVLGVSDMTVRRDLRKLQHEGRVRVVHGGASAVSSPPRSSAFAGRAQQSAGGKARIGRAVADALPAAATVAVDAGTTAYACIQALPDTFHGSLVTHSIPVVALMLNRDGARVVGLGGELSPGSQAFVGPRTVEATAGLRVQTFLLGAAAADERGVYVLTDIERPTKLALMAIADEVVLVADHAKFTAPAPVRLCGWEQIARVVTDAALPRAVARSLAALRIPVVVPGV